MPIKRRDYDGLSDVKAESMRRETTVELYIDEDIERVLVNQLRGFGYSVKTVEELGHKRNLTNFK